MTDEKSYAQSVLNDAFGKYYAEIYRFCLSYMTRDRASVEDCVQDTFVVLYNKLLKGEEIVNVRAYLYKTAENVIHAKIRELKKHTEYVNIEEIINLPSLNEEMTEKLSFEEYYRQISDALPDKEAELFRLRYIEDLSIESVAELMGMTFSATGTRLHRLKKKIAVIIKEIM